MNFYLVKSNEISDVHHIKTNVRKYKIICEHTAIEQREKLVRILSETEFQSAGTKFFVISEED